MPPRVHLHRVVPSVPSRWSGCPLHPWKSYRTQGSHATSACPPLEAARPIDESDDGFTSASTISTGGFRRLDAASALSAPQSRLAIRPLAAQRSPATISIFSESRVEAARLRKRTAGFLRRDRERSERWRSAARDKGTGHSAWLHRESRCIALFWANHPFGAAIHCPKS